MSEPTNPLFESQKEFLERQRQEYKNALLSDVQEIKTQSQKVGKTLLIAGGALAGLWMVSRLFQGKKKSKQLSAPAPPAPAQAWLPAEGSVYPPQSPPVVYPAAYPPAPSAATEITRTFLQSDLAKAISQQLTAFLLIYITKKIEEYLQEVKASTALAASPREPETKDVDFSYHQEDAI